VRVKAADVADADAADADTVDVIVVDSFVGSLVRWLVGIVCITLNVSIFI